MSLSRKLCFYFGATSLVAVIWVVGTGFEAWLGLIIAALVALLLGAEVERRLRDTS